MALSLCLAAVREVGWFEILQATVGLAGPVRQSRTPGGERVVQLQAAHRSGKRSCGVLAVLMMLVGQRLIDVGSTDQTGGRELPGSVWLLGGASSRWITPPIFQVSRRSLES